MWHQEAQAGLGCAAGLSWAGTGIALVGPAWVSAGVQTLPPSSRLAGADAPLWEGCGLQPLCSLCQARAEQALALLFKPIIAGDCIQSKRRWGVCACYRSQYMTSAGFLPSGPAQERPAQQPPALATNPTEGVAEPGPTVAPPLPLPYLPCLSGLLFKAEQEPGILFSLGPRGL